MTANQVHTPEQALAYIIDCTLATVQAMAMKKSRPAGEFKRQINIAQRGVDWMVGMHVPTEGTRAEGIVSEGLSVAEWAERSKT